MSRGIKLIMKFLIIIILISVLLFSIEIDVSNTTWIEKSTNRPIYVIKQEQIVITYKYAGEPFERTMGIKDLFINFKKLKNE